MFAELKNILHDFLSSLFSRQANIIVAFNTIGSGVARKTEYTYQSIGFFGRHPIPVQLFLIMLN